MAWWPPPLDRPVREEREVVTDSADGDEAQAARRAAEDAEDVLQETLLAAWQGLSGYEGRAAPPWSPC